MATPTVITKLCNEFSLGAGLRAAIYLLYSGQIDILFRLTYIAPSGFIYPLSVLHYSTYILFGAALLYFVAWLRGHNWVSSKLLGGSGVEPMTLIIPG